MIARSRRRAGERHDRRARRPHARALGLATAALLALGAPTAAAAAPTLVVTRGCAASIPVEGPGQGEGIAFFNGSGFTPNGAAAINYTRLPTGATASNANTNPPAYYDQQTDSSGTFVQGTPPRIDHATRPQILPGLATVVAKDLDTQLSSNSVSFQVAVTGVVAPKHVHRKAKLHVRAFAVGLLPVVGASSTAYVHFVQGSQDVATRKVGPPAGPCATVNAKVKPPKPGSYNVLVDTVKHPSGVELNNPNFSTKVTVKR